MSDSPVIAAVDGSDASLLAVDWAAREAVLRSQPLRIVSVPALPPRMMRYREAPGTPDTVSDTVHSAYRHALESAAARASQAEPGLTVSTALLSGAPAMVVAGAAASGSLLVVGSRGNGGLSSLVLGSVSRYAGDHSAGPVVVARLNGIIERRRVVVGVRDGDHLAALEFAFQEAALRGAGLHVLHAWDWSLPGALLPSALRPGADPEQVSADAEQWLADLLSGWRDKYPAVVVSQRVQYASPSQALVDVSARADLVVLGRPASQSGDRGRGAVRHAVLHHAECPVAVIPG